MTFAAEELDRIAAHLEATGEIDTRYSYMGEGAAAWDRFVTWQQGDNTPNLLHSTLDMLRDAHDDLIASLPGPVRVVDLGPGNGVPVRGMLERLQAAGRLERYVGVDASAEMLAIAEANLRAWLGAAAPLQFHRRDFTTDPLADLRGPATLALLAGGTLLNFTDPVAVLRHLREVADVIAFVARPDTVASRASFRFSEDEAGEDIAEDYRAMLDHLGVRRDTYEPEVGFDSVTRERYLRIRLTSEVTVAERVTLPAGRRVHLFRYHHRSENELTTMLKAAACTPLTSRRSPAGDFLLLAASV